LALVRYCSSSINNSSYRCCEISSSPDIRQPERKIPPNLSLTLSICFCFVAGATVRLTESPTVRQTDTIHGGVHGRNCMRERTQS
jgi:hypothetical protein